jgi:hypothetical protein
MVTAMQHTALLLSLLLVSGRIHHQKSRYVFDLFYKRKAISRGMNVSSARSIVTTHKCMKLASLATSTGAMALSGELDME